METVTVQGTPILLDQLLWRRYGVAGQTLLEKTLELNPGLAGAGAVLAIGAVIILPAQPEPGVATRKVVTLFG